MKKINRGIIPYLLGAKVKKQKQMNKKLKRLKKSIKKISKITVNLIVMVGLLLPNLAITSVSAIEIEAVNVSNIEDNPEWGQLVQYTDLGTSYQEEVVNKIKAIKASPEQFINNNNLSSEEIYKLADKVSKVSEDLVFQEVEEIDSQFEANQLLESVNNSSEDVLDSLKQAGVIKTHIGEDGIETITDPTILEENGKLKTKSTPHQTTIPELADDQLEIGFAGVETNEDQSTDEVQYKIGYEPVGANRSKALYEENKVLYKNFWDGVDLVYTANADNLKEDIILKNNNTRQINNQYSGYRGDDNWVFLYELDLENLEVQKEDGQIKFVNKDGVAQATITSPFLIDNNGVISQNAYYELVTEDQYEAGFEVDESVFDLNEKDYTEGENNERNDIDDIIPVPEIDQTTPAASTEDDLTATTSSTVKKGFWESTWDSIVDWFSSATNIFGTTKAQDNNDLIEEESEPIEEITDLTTEYDQTKSPVEQIGMEAEVGKEEDDDGEYKYLALVVNTANLEYPIDVDPTTYILTTSDVYNSANGQLLTNSVTDAILYDTTTEPTSNYAYNQQLKTTLSLNNSIGTVNPANLVGLWNFDENDLTLTVEDDSTTPANGTLSGNGANVPEYVRGQVNTGLDFQSANNEYVDMGDDDDLSFTGDLAISAWINPDNLDAIYPVLSKGQTAGDREYYLGITPDGQVEFKAWQSNSSTLHFSLTSPKQVIKPNSWTHIVVSNDSGNEAKLYINNVLRAQTTTYAGSMGNDDEGLQIGRGNDGTSLYHFDGQIDEIKLYASSLTQNEILNLYDNAKSKLVGWWDMQSGGTDYSGQNNNGTLTGTTLIDNGKVNGSRLFTTSDKIDLGDNSSLSPSDNLSVEAWVKTDSLGTILVKDNEYKLEVCGDGQPMMFVYANSQWQSNAGTGNGCTGSQATQINDNNWHHLVGTYDGKYIRLYMDGYLSSSYYFAGSIDKTTNHAVIGDNSYTGEIDEVAIYNRPLSSDDAYAHAKWSYERRVNNITRFDTVIELGQYSQLALDNIYVTRGGVLKVRGTDADDKEVIENIKLKEGYITRVLSSNRFKSISELTALNEYGEATGEKLQIAEGSILAFSPYHDGNWRYGISKVDDLVRGVWHFDEGAGAVAYDSSSSNNTAYLAGGQSGNWQYQRDIDLAPATPENDYQVNVLFEPSTFDYNHARSDGYDLRFYDTDNNLLTHWIESWNPNGNSSVWVKVPTSGTSKIIMKYGNPDADDISDGESTFVFFDDFDGDSLDSEKWPTDGFGSTYSDVSDSIFSFWSTNGTWKNVTASYTSSPTDLFVTHVKHKQDGDNQVHLSYDGTSSRFGIHPNYNDTATGPRMQTGISGSYVSRSVYANTDFDTWYIHGYERDSSIAATVYTLDDSYNLLGKDSETASAWSTVDFTFNAHEYRTTKNYIDWIFTAKKAENPTEATIGGIVLSPEAYSSQPSWYNTSWGYRAEIEIDNSQNPVSLNNYQTLVSIDVSELVPSMMQADFDDIRFTESDMTTPIDYFYDSYHSSTNATKFWVEVPNIPAKSSTSIYVYFGNSGASSASSFDNTFSKNINETDLVGLYHLDEGSGTTINDSSPVGNDGTLVTDDAGLTWAGSDGGQWDGESAVSFSAGDHIDFDGTNDYITTSDNTYIDFDTDDSFTLSAWINDNSSAGDDNMIIAKQRNGGYQGYYLLRQPSTGYIYLILQYNSSYYISVRTNTALNDTNWHHIVASYDGSGYAAGVSIYIDGELQATTSNQDNLGTYSISNAYPLTIGSRDSGGIKMDGLIDEATVYARELDKAEIRSLYERRYNALLEPYVSTSTDSIDSQLPDWSANGKYGGALSFDGQNDFVVVPDEDSLNASNQLTVGAWINPGALDGWLYTKKLELSPPTPMDDYQLELVLNNNNFDYLKAKEDGSDLRFADSDGNTINYWIERWDPFGSSIIWLKAPNADTSLIYMYYGNDTATAASSFDNTFTKNFTNDNLVGAWNFDDTADPTTDSSGSGNDGILGTAVSPDTTRDPAWQGSEGGRWSNYNDVNFSTGDHLYFDGSSNQQVYLGNPSELQISTMTIEAWIKHEATGRNDMIVGWGANGWAFYTRTDNRLGFGKVGVNEQYSEIVLTDSDWHHVAVVYDSSINNLKFYVDGSLNRSVTYNNPSFTFGTQAAIGLRQDNQAMDFYGSIDGVNIYNDTLSADEIAAHYERRNYSDTASAISTDSEEGPSTAYLYRRDISLNPITSISNQVVQVELNTTDFDYNKVRGDGADLRFSDAGNNNLDYYIENWDPGGTSTIYVKVPFAGTSTIYMHYGNSDTYSQSSGEDTLAIFDDFEDGQLDRDKWAFVHEDEASWNEGVDEDGWLKLKALNGKNMWQDEATAPMILSHQDLFADDYDIYTTVWFPNSGEPNNDDQQAGIIIYQDDNNYIQANMMYSGTSNKQVAGFKLESDNSAFVEEQDFSIPAVTDIRISKTGNAYTMYYKDHSSDTWIEHVTSINKELGVEHIGLISFSNTSADALVYFDDFKVVKKYSSPPVASINDNDESWTYKRNLNITPATSLDNEQVQVILDSSFNYSNVRTNGEDIRFFDKDWNVLSHWIEFWNNGSGQSSIYVDIPDANTSQIYMYYGNSNVSSGSSGDLTFQFFEDFAGTTLDTNTWTEIDNSSDYLTVNDAVILSGGTNSWGSSALISNVTFERLEGTELNYSYKPTASGSHVMHGWHNDTLGAHYSNLTYAYYDAGNTLDVYEDGNNRSPLLAGTWSAGTNYRIRMPLKTTGGAEYYRGTDGLTWEKNYDSDYSSASPLRIGLCNHSKQFEYDTVFVRKIASNAEYQTTLETENRWLYQKEINLSSSTPANDYQVKIEIGSSDINYENVQDDGADIRFYDSNGEKLSYWIERWAEGGDSIVWVKVPTTGTNKLTMFYGNPDAEDESNGEATFDLFDDFDDRSLDTDIWTWTRGVSGAWDEGISQQGFLMIEALNGSNLYETDNSAPVLLADDLAGQDFEVTVRMQFNPSENYQQGGLIVYEDDDNYIQGNRGYSSNQVVTFKDEDSDSVTSSDVIYDNNDVDLKLRKVNDSFRFYYKKHHETIWNEFGAGPTEYDLTMTVAKVGLSAYSDNGSDINTYYDDFRVNKINNIDPANDITASFAAEQVKQVDINETNNIAKKGSSFAIGSTDTDVYATLDSQSISAPLPDGWSHVVQTFDGKNQKLFVNGELQSSLEYDQSLSVSSDDMIIGENYYGMIDDLVVAKQSMSDSQVANWYQSDQAYLKTQPIDNQSEYRVANQAPTDGLVGHWNLDEGSGTLTVDSSSEGNDGTLTNGPAWGAGVSNYAVVFDGSNDYVNFGNISDYQFEYYDSFTLSSWIKSDQTDSNDIFIAKNQNGGDYRGYYCYLEGSTGYIKCEIRSTVDYRISVSMPVAVNDGDWHHIAMTYDGSSTADGIKIYLDGYEQNAITVNDTLGTNTILDDAPLTIGSRESGNTPFNGSIDEVRVYNTELSAAQVYSLFDEFTVFNTLSQPAATSSHINISGNQAFASDKLMIKIESSGVTGAASYKTSDNDGIGWSNATYVTSNENSNLLIDGVDSGVDISFDLGSNWQNGSVYKIASWYTEPKSSDRGIRRSFPEVAAIVATSQYNSGPDNYLSSIDIIDTTDNSLWMRFTNSTEDSFLLGPNIKINQIDAAYGNLFAASGLHNGDSMGVLQNNFIDDAARYYTNSTNNEIIVDNIANRNTNNITVNDDTITLDKLDVAGIDVAMLEDRLYLAATTYDAAIGEGGAVNLIDMADMNLVRGSSGADDSGAVKLAGNGNLYFDNTTDQNVIAIDAVTAYDSDFNFANYNEAFANSTPTTYYLPGTTINDIAVHESKSIADEYASDRIAVATDAGVGLIDTMESLVTNDSSENNHNGFNRILTDEYITENMNGADNIIGMWIAGDQTPAVTVADRSIHGNDMSVVGFSSNQIDDADLENGVRGKSIVFGGSDYLRVDHDASFDLRDSNNVTFGAWVKPNSVSGTDTIMAQWAGGPFKLDAEQSGGKVVYNSNISKNSTTYTASSQEYDLTDTWHYVVGAHDGINNILKIYVDGELEGDVTTPAEYDLGYADRRVTIGAYHGGNEFFNGNIGGAFLTKSLLNDNQIKRLYNIGLGALNDNSDELNQIGGGSANVSALDYDKKNQKIYVGTSAGLSEINLTSDVQTNYWNTTTTPALPANAITAVDYADDKVLAATSSGALLIKTDGSYTNSSSVGKLMSGKGNDVYTDGTYNYYASDAGLDVVEISTQTRLGWVLREGGFNSVVAFGGYAYMGTDDDGVYRVNVSTMTGETEIDSPTFYVGSSKPLLSDNIYDVHGQKIDGKDYLVVATDEGAQIIADVYGTPKRAYYYYNEGDDVTKIWLNASGDMAYYNATDKTVNVVDSAINVIISPNYYTNSNSYTRQYSTETTPNIAGSDVNDLVYMANTSTAEANRDTLYVATNNGVSVIQEHDTVTSGTVEHYANKYLHDERTGLMLPFDDFEPENVYTASNINTVNQYDPLREKYDFLSDPDLVGYWDFDQTMPAGVADRSGYGNDGGNGPNTGTLGGKLGQALYLDGSKSYLVINEDKSLHPTSEFSWSGWVWKDGAISNDASGQPILASKYDSGDNGEFVLYFNKNNKLQLKVSDGSTSATSSESTAIGTEEWHHVAVTFESGTVKFYIDGELDSTYTVGVTNLQMPPYNNDPTKMTDLYLGNDWSVFDNAFGGYMDEVAYYTRAISDEEVKSHYSLPERTNSVTVDNQDSLAYRTSANMTTASGAQETLYLNFDENLAGNQGESFDTAIESELHKPNLNMISYSASTNNNIVLDLGTSGDWDDYHVFSPYVIKDGDNYMMWYVGNDSTNNRIGLAVSKDGTRWDKYGSNNCSGTTGDGCVFSLGSGFDSNWVYAPSVIKEGNTFKMWYAGFDGSNIEIGYATSTDGVNWTRQNGGNPVLTAGTAGSWDDADVSYPRVMKEGSVYKMWYGGQQAASNWRVGYATSSDGINWTKYDDVASAACGTSEANDDGCIVGLGGSGAMDENDIENTNISKINDKYYMNYTGSDSGGTEKAGLMTSDNGITWTRANDGATIMDLGTSGAWDDAAINGPNIVYDDNQMKGYYSGDDGTNLRIGLATLDFETGRYGKSLRIEDNDVYQYNVTNDLNRGYGTVSAWVKLDSATDAQHEIFNIQSPSNSEQDGLYLALKSNEIMAGYNGERALLIDIALTNNYWHHVALTWEKPSQSNQSFKLYLDGELIDATTFDSAIGYDYTQLQLGGNNGESREYLNGNIDEFRMYNQALNADDITELYNGSLGNSAKINTISKAAEGTIEFMFTPDWDSATDNDTRTLFDTLGGDESRVDEQYNQSQTAINRFRIWKDEGEAAGTNANDRLHFGILDNDGDLYEVYTEDSIDFTADTTYKITAQWDLDNTDAAGENEMRILVDDAIVAGDNFDTGDTANKKKNGGDTSINEVITIDMLSEKMWLGGGMPNNQINLINNPSFEEFSGVNPANWNITGSVAYNVSSSEVKYGNSAVSVTGPDTTNKLSQTIKGLAPGTWTLSWWTQGTAVDSNQAVDVAISAGALTGTTSNSDVVGNTYKYNTMTFANDTYGDLTLDLSAASGETVFFDGITLVKGRMDENFQNTSGSYSDYKTSNYVLSEEELEAEYLAATYDSSNQNASLAGETNNAQAIAVKKIFASGTASDDILFVGTKGETNEGAVTQITFGTPDLRTDEWRQATSGNSLTSNRINSISYSLIRNNLAVATDNAGIFGFYEDVPAVIDINSPNGAEEWEGGSSQDITWTVSTGTCDSVDLFYTTDGGSNWETIVTGAPDIGSYTWDPVAELNSNSTLIKAICVDPFSVELASDVSDANFIVDSTSPTFEILGVPNPSGDNIIYVKGTATDEGGATEITEIQYRIDDDASWYDVYVTSGAGTTSQEFDFSTPELAVGPHTIYMKGKDSSLPDGNESDLTTPNSVSFNVDSLEVSFDQTDFNLDLSVNGETDMTGTVRVTVNGYGTYYNLGIKANQPPTNKYYPSETIPFYTGNDDWNSSTIGFGWKTNNYNSGNYNDFETSSYEIFKQSYASLVGDVTDVDFKTAIDWTVPAGKYQSTVSVVVIPRY